MTRPRCITDRTLNQISTMTNRSPDEPGCGCDDSHDCPLPSSRRRFLRDTFLTVAGTMVALGATRAQALAMPLEVITARGRKGNTRSYAIPEGDGAQIDKDNQVILMRWQNTMWAFNLSCPHQNTALRWEAQDHEFECPKHHSKYRPDGTFIEGRATRGMDRLAITRQGNDVLVDLDTLYQEDTNPAEWNAAEIKLA